MARFAKKKPPKPDRHTFLQTIQGCHESRVSASWEQSSSLLEQLVEMAISLIAISPTNRRLGCHKVAPSGSLPRHMTRRDFRGIPASPLKRPLKMAFRGVQFFGKPRRILQASFSLSQNGKITAIISPIYRKSEGDQSLRGHLTAQAQALGWTSQKREILLPQPAQGPRYEHLVWI